MGPISIWMRPTLITRLILPDPEAMLLGPEVSNYHYALSGYNTTLCDFEKYQGAPMPRDCDRLIAHIDFEEN